MQKTIQSFNHTVEKSYQWLKELKELGNFHNEEESYTVLRAVLHALRDRLILNEAIHLASQLPMLIRGFYYEGWKPSEPSKIKAKEEFLDEVRNNLRNAVKHIATEKAVLSVISLLEKKISLGEIDYIKSELPKGIASLIINSNFISNYNA